MNALLLFAFAAAGIGIAKAQVPSPPRTEVAIREVILSNGTKRYAIPITIGGTTVDAGLDTGSAGLRVLHHALIGDDARPTGRSDTIFFGAGARLTGPVADATVRIGDVAGTARIQLIDVVDCAAGRADCAAGRVAAADYGIQGDGLPGEGFKAILGLNTADTTVPSILGPLGVRRWLIELPRPGQSSPGRLVLDPTDEEIAGFTALSRSSFFASSRGGLHDAVDGCVTNETSRKSFCGSVLLDTGAPGITVEADGTGAQWPPGTPAILSFLKNRSAIAASAFVTDRRDEASHFTLRDGHRSPDGGGGPPIIHAGVLPYLVWAVLYDMERNTISVKARPVMDGGPTVVPVK